MELNEKDIISNFVKLRETLNNLLEKKYDAMDQLNEEIEILKDSIKEIDSFVSAKSFTTADQLLDTVSFLETKQEKKLENLDVTRKIFSKKDPAVLLLIFRYDGKKIDIYFPNPQVTKLTPFSELYIMDFIEPLMNLKDNEKNMEFKIEKQNEKGIITKLAIENILSFENMERIFDIFESAIEKMNS